MLAIALPARPQVPSSATLPSSGLRWAYATLPPGDPYTLSQAHADPVRRQVNAGLLFSVAHATFVWARAGLDVTAIMEDRVAGRPLRPLPPVNPIRAIAVVNVQQLVADTPLGKSLSAQVDALIAKLNGEISARQKRLAALEQALSDGTFRTDADRAAIREQIDAARRGVVFTQQSAEASVQELRDRLQKQFIQSVASIVERFAVPSNIDVVLAAQGGLAYVRPASDVTATILRMAATPGATEAAINMPPVRQVAFLSTNRLIAETLLGKQGQAQLAALQEAKKRDLADKNLAPAAQQAIADLNAELFRAFSEKGLPVVQQLCAARGIDLVLEREYTGLMAADPALDITNDVIRAIDAAYPK